jgi:hypothetical protein
MAQCNPFLHGWAKGILFLEEVAAEETMGRRRHHPRTQPNGNGGGRVVMNPKNCMKEVEAGREGLLEMLHATCSPKGNWNVRAAHAAHKQQGGGMTLRSFQLAAGRLRDDESGATS